MNIYDVNNQLKRYTSSKKIENIGNNIDNNNMLKGFNTWKQHTENERNRISRLDSLLAVK